MAPELPEPQIRRVVRQRMREGMLSVTTSPVRLAIVASGKSVCAVCGFSITAGRSECDVSGLRAHEQCAVIWREESDRTA
jgi:hypothetical protein